MEDSGEHQRVGDMSGEENAYRVLTPKEYDDLVEKAYYDSHIKDILNVNGFEKSVFPQIEKAKEKDYSITFAFIDTDKLKAVNDKFGHEKGDEILILLKNLLHKKFKRGTDVIAVDHVGSEKIGSEVGKWGGDEFLISLPLTDREAAERLLTELREEFEAEARMKVPGIEPSFSFGTALINEKLVGDFDRDKLCVGGIEVEEVDIKDISPEEILKNALKVAEMRMYKDKKERGQGRV